MAINFIDLFPDSPAAVAGGQGARDILENQYKQSMGFMEMENALMKNIQARKAMEEQARQEPLQKAVDTVKLLQGLNMVGGESPFKDVDLMDQESVRNALMRSAASGNIYTNPEIDLMKTRASAQEQAARAQLLEGGRMSRDYSSRVQEDEKLRIKEAADRVKGLIEPGGRWEKTPDPKRRDFQKKAAELISDYQGLLAYGDTPSTRLFYNKHSKILAAAGVPAPGQRAAPKKEEPPKQNKIYTSKSGKRYELTPQGPKEI